MKTMEAVRTSETSQIIIIISSGALQNLQVTVKKYFLPEVESFVGNETVYIPCHRARFINKTV
jgi:hypothetical protein